MSPPGRPKGEPEAHARDRAPGVPVALFVFNRPGLTRDAMRRLAAIRPARLLVVADGPRHDDETQRCHETRAAVREGITWDAVVDFLESDTNLGCRRRLETGLDWVFNTVDRAVVLEDDIEVTPAFFPAAAEGLARLADRPEVRMLSARNALVEWPAAARPFLGRAGSIWGWATWADRWQAYRRGFRAAEAPDGNVAREQLRAGLARHASFELHRRLQTHLLDTRLWQRIDTWDIPWSLWNLATGGLCCTLPRNLSANHGIGREATHTTAAEDLRGQLPLTAWAHRPGDFDAPPLREDYARACTLLELVMNYDEPRRWKLLARRRDHLPPAASGPGWDLMLAPFDHAAETAGWLAHLARWLGGPQLDGLREVFGPGLSDSPMPRTRC